MRNHHNPRKKYPALEKLSVEELENLLRTANPDSEDASDETYYTAIEEVLIQKERENPSGRLPDIDELQQEFRQSYLSPEMEGVRLYGEEPPAPVKEEPAKKPSRIRSGVRKVLPIAAALAIVFAASLVVQASGIDIYGAVARWTKDTFHFTSTQPATDVYGFQETSVSQELTDALAAQGIPASFAPGWLPEEYGDYSIESYVTADDSVVEFVALSEQGEVVMIHFTEYRNTVSMTDTIYEKDGSNVEEYLHGSQTFYIFCNTTGIQSVWADGKYSIHIFGNVPIGITKKIIDSI